MMIFLTITSWFSQAAVSRLIRFGLTGLCGMVVDFAVTALVKEVLGWNKYLANALGFCFAVCCNYVINRRWTFGNTSADILPQLGLFAGISLVGLLLNTLFIFLLHQQWKLNFYLSKCMAILLVFGWNYWANSHFTFTLYH